MADIQKQYSLIFTPSYIVPILHTLLSKSALFTYDSVIYLLVVLLILFTLGERQQCKNQTYFISLRDPFPRSVPRLFLHCCSSLALSLSLMYSLQDLQTEVLPSEDC